MKNKSINNATLRWLRGTFSCFLMLLSLFCYNCFAQVGINTTDPKGTLDITTTNNTGLVIPRVTAIEDVTDGAGNPPLNGTQVFDISRNAMCFYQNDTWICIGINGNGDPILTDETNPSNPNYDSDGVYVKSSNNDFFDHFGYSTVLSNDGNTLAVSAYQEASNATGINGNQTNNSLSGSGAVFIFINTAGVWSQQAYIKASNTGANDHFGNDLALSSDGNTLAVGAGEEASNATGVNGNQSDNSSSLSGATYIFTRNGATWSQEAYIKASNTGSGDFFGHRVALASDGNTLAVSAPYEDSNATGINGSGANNSSMTSGAAYVFNRTGSIWTQQAYIKASNTGASDLFGFALDLSNDGDTLAVGAYGEDSNATGINGNQNDNSTNNTGAVYVFDRAGVTWTQQTYLKTSNAEALDQFGRTVAVSGDGNTVASGAVGILNEGVDTGEDSMATGINGDETDNAEISSGAVYTFNRVAAVWSQQAYVKSIDTDSYDFFGYSLSLSEDGTVIALGAVQECSMAIGIDGDASNDLGFYNGAVYVYTSN